MKLFQWRRGMLRQIWFWFLVLLPVNQLLLLGCLYIFVIRPAAEISTVTSMALIDVIHQQRLGTKNLQSTQPLGLITDRWVSRNHIMVIPGTPQGAVSLPPMPFFQLIGQYVREGFSGRVDVAYTRDPEPMLWFTYDGPERFSVGFPVYQRLMAMYFLLSAALLILVLSAFASWVIAVRLTRPLNHLSDVALRLGQGGAMSEIRLDDDASMEVIRLADALNQMRTEINQMLAERERFLAGIAHDLRTPLSRMRVALELNTSQEQDLSDGLREDVEEMRHILDQFLELSRLDTEQSEAAQTGSLNAELISMREKYQRAGELLQLDLGELHPLCFRRLALRRLLYNLIDNALRHGDGVVILKTRMSEDGGICLSVSNRRTEAIRDSALVSALRAQSRHQQSGLGLAIVRRIAEVHGATLSFADVGDNGRLVEIQFSSVTN